MPLSRSAPELRSDVHRSLRLWCRFDRSVVELIRVTPLAGHALPSVPVGDGRPLAGMSGAWVEVRDRGGRCLWRRPVHDPFGTTIEVPDDDSGYTTRYRKNPSGTL